jgi:tryptophanyl-tRNA synthetase
MHQALQAPEPLAEIDRNCRSGALPCGECKMRLRDVMVAELAPVREKGAELKADPRRVLHVLQEGAEKARSIARGTLAEVRSAMGLTTAGRA